MLRNIGTVRPIFTKIASKVAQDSKAKSCESALREKKFIRVKGDEKADIDNRVVCIGQGGISGSCLTRLIGKRS